MGDGLAIIPTDGKVFAPFDGEIVALMNSGHAVALKSNDGIELLIHVGLDTVALKGEPFTLHAKKGKIKKGSLILEVNLEQIRQKGYNTITPLIITNTSDFTKINSISKTEAKVLEPILQIVKE